MRRRPHSDASCSHIPHSEARTRNEHTEAAPYNTSRGVRHDIAANQISADVRVSGSQRAEVTLKLTLVDPASLLIPVQIASYSA